MLYYLYRIGRFLALNLPLQVCYKMAIFVADIYYMFAWKDRKNLKYNLKIVLENNDKKLIKRYTRNIFRNFAKYLADFFRYAKLTKEYMLTSVTIEGKENLDKALAIGKGAILLSAHLGNWELGAAIVASLGYPFYAIALDHKDKRVNDFFLKQRAICDVKIIPIGSQLKNCFKVLRENQLLAIIGDKDFSHHGIKSDFFNRSTILPKGPAFFSLRTGAPIIPTFLIRTANNNFKLVLEKPIETKQTGDEANDIRNIMKKYIAVIEQYIRAFPDQWYAFRRVWD